MTASQIRYAQFLLHRFCFFSMVAAIRFTLNEVQGSPAFAAHLFLTPSNRQYFPRQQNATPPMDVKLNFTSADNSNHNSWSLGSSDNVPDVATSSTATSGATSFSSNAGSLGDSAWGKRDGNKLFASNSSTSTTANSTTANNSTSNNQNCWDGHNVGISRSAISGDGGGNGRRDGSTKGEWQPTIK